MITGTTHTLFGNYFTKEAFYAYCYLNDFDPNYIEKKMKEILNKGLGKCTIVRSREKDFYKYIDKILV